MSSSSALSSARRRRAAPEFNQATDNLNSQQQNQQQNKPQVTPVQLLQQHDIRLHKLENDIPDVINEIQQNMALLLEERDNRLTENTQNNLKSDNNLDYSSLLSNVESQDNNKSTERYLEQMERDNEFLRQQLERIQKLTKNY